jgi:hypothetical protein
MSRNLWFALGFAAAWLVVAALLLLPIVNTEAARSWLEPIGRPTATAAQPTHMSQPDPTPSSQPTPEVSGLSWLFQGSMAGACERLEIDAAKAAHYAPCDQGPRLAPLTEPELRTFADAVSQFAPFAYAVQRDQGRVGVVRLTFAGQGRTPATVDQQAELARWAEGVYTRLYQQELRANLVAQARLLLAATSEQPIDEIEVVAASPETWPDACLGIVTAGVDCAQVVTPGYRIRLAVAGTTYELHTDLRGTVRLAPAP